MAYSSALRPLSSKNPDISPEPCLSPSARPVGWEEGYSMRALLTSAITLAVGYAVIHTVNHIFTAFAARLP